MVFRHAPIPRKGSGKQKQQECLGISVANESIEWTVFGKTSFVFLYEKFEVQLAIAPNSSRYEIYLLFFDDKIIDLIVQETGRYVDQWLGAKSLKPQSRFKKWKPTTPDEIGSFLENIVVID